MATAPHAATGELGERQLPWRAILIALLAVSFALTVLSLVAPLVAADPAWTEETGEFRLFVDVVHDHNPPTWWNGVLLSTAAATYVAAAAMSPASGARPVVAWLAG